MRLLPVCNDALILLPIWGSEATVEIIARRSGSVYDPEVVAAFVPVAEALISDAEAGDPWERTMALDPGAGAELNAGQLDDACWTIADFCDLKLPHAISHSRAVAVLAEEAGRSLGLPPTPWSLSAAPRCCTISATRRCRSAPAAAMRSGCRPPATSSSTPFTARSCYPGCRGSRADFPLLGKWTGKDGVGAFFACLAEIHDFTEFSPKEFCASGDKVFVCGHYEMNLRKTGRHAAMDWVHIFTLRDGMCAGFREHTDTAALAGAYRG